MLGTVAPDTGADSLHSYHHKLCLVQLPVDGESVLLDPRADACRDLESRRTTGSLLLLP